jgi:hypothetical protein
VSKHHVTIFEPYPFEKGQKIRIEGSRRGGDWEVIDFSDLKVTLRCPLSGKELTLDRFCHFVAEKEDYPWPQT